MGLYDIDIKELTDSVVISSDNEVSGSGIFDTLMVTVSKHIEAQYREGRILGTEYSNVYLGALQAVLDLSTKILLEKDLIAKQAEEIDSRISVNSKQIEKLTSDIANDLARTTSEVSLKDSQKALTDQQLLTEVQNTTQVTAQTDLITAQTTKVNSDKTIAEEQSAKDLSLKEAQISKLASEETNDTQRTANDTSRTTADVSLKDSQKTLVDQQKLTEVQNTLLVTEQKNKIVSDVTIAEAQSAKDLLIKDGQISKVDYEISNLLPAQKELIVGQTTNEGKKGNLIDYQRHGLKVDAMYKNVKTLLDTWSIYYSITPDSLNLLQNLEKDNMDNTVNTLATAINQFPAIEEG
jgi:hypothetical protein